MSKSSASPAQSILHLTEAWISRSGDSADQRLRKLIIFSFLTLAWGFHLAHAIFFASGGAYRAAAVNAAGCVISLSFAAAMVHIKGQLVLWRIYAAAHLLLMFGVNHFLGGVNHAQGSLIYVLFFPLVVYSVDNTKAALITLAAGILLYGVSVALTPYAPTDQLLSPWMATLLGLINMVGTTGIGLIAIHLYGRQTKLLTSQLIKEKDARSQETQALLENILPKDVARELVETGNTRPVRHEAISVLFTDFSGFTQASAAMPPELVVLELNEIFAAFDDICDARGVEKIKTIGDAYMAAAGVPIACPDHAQRCIQVGLQMLQFMEARNARSAFKWGLRVGIHAGPAVSGVVGKRKYAYDVWGDTVNIASRMESSGEVGRVNISAYTFHLVRDTVPCEYRGRVEVKGKGPIDMYFVSKDAAAL